MWQRAPCSDVILHISAGEAGFTLTHFESIGSTNDAAMARLRDGGSGDHWIIADEQLGGRGRLGRSWSSPKGNVYASLALYAPCPMQSGFQLGFVAALAIYDAAVVLGVSPDRLSLKWPNDVLLEGAKLSGILVEGGSLPDGTFGAVIGCGVNVTHHPSDTPYPATDLVASGVSVSVADTFSTLARCFRTNLDVFRKGQGFLDIRQRWIDRARGIGGPISVRQANGSLEGIFQGLDEDGKLLLLQDGKVTPIIAGDVFY